MPSTNCVIARNLQAAPEVLAVVCVAHRGVLTTWPRARRLTLRAGSSRPQPLLVCPTARNSLYASVSFFLLLCGDVLYFSSVGRKERRFSVVLFVLFLCLRVLFGCCKKVFVGLWRVGRAGELPLAPAPCHELFFAFDVCFTLA